jgi:hypothetical protein
LGERTYNTNLAAEFHVLSCLHRLGLTATLTLGNKKSVDVVVVRATGDAVTIDVKGLAGTTSWPVKHGRGKRDHHLVFVSFLGKIDDPESSPEVYVVPSLDLKRFIYTHERSGRQFVPLRRLRAKGVQYRHAWKLITETQ